LQERGIGSGLWLRWSGDVSTGAGGEVTTHKMHGEWVEVSAETVEQFRAKAERSDYCGGTTVVRALEGAAESGSYNRLRQDELVYLSRLPVACGGRTDYKFSSLAC